MIFKITQSEKEPSELPKRDYEISLDTQDRAVRHLEITSLDDLMQFQAEAKHPLIIIEPFNEGDCFEVEIYNTSRE
jgi:hypothetical protein